jgi:hypothetical protein
MTDETGIGMVVLKVNVEIDPEQGLVKHMMSMPGMSVEINLLPEQANWHEVMAVLGGLKQILKQTMSDVTGEDASPDESEVVFIDMRRDDDE